MGEVEEKMKLISNCEINKFGEHPPKSPLKGGLKADIIQWDS